MNLIIVTQKPLWSWQDGSFHESKNLIQIHTATAQNEEYNGSTQYLCYFVYYTYMNTVKLIQELKEKGEGNSLPNSRGNMLCQTHSVQHERIKNK